MEGKEKEWKNEVLSTEGCREETRDERVGYAELPVIIFPSIFLIQLDVRLSVCAVRANFSTTSSPAQQPSLLPTQ
jgi:hypothetical protein